MPDASISLDDKYALQSGRVFLTGTQALVRLTMMQRQRDLANGLNTACYVTGYRGSPVGGVDQQMWRARKFLKDNHVHFQPGVNEDLAATAVWGTQYGDVYGDFNYDGVYSMWYGKGPGVDRSGDVFRHGNMAGTAKNGGVLLLAGDDHAAKSSTTTHQCEYAFMDSLIPVLNPAGVQEFLDLGLYGWAMSRFSGCWVGFKIIAETADSTASVYVDPLRIPITLPEDFEMPPGGLNIRWDGGLGMLEREELHHRYKIYAARAFARANKLDKVILDSPQRKIGIVTAGKSYLDVRQALDDLGIDEATAGKLGISLYKVALTWPLEPEGARAFCEGLDEILIVEEKRAVMENQLKEQLYNWHTDKRPRIIGKFDRDYPDQPSQALLPSYNELTPAMVARAIGQVLQRHGIMTDAIKARLEFLDRKEKEIKGEVTPIKRVPHFCSGCPHNTSTKVPEGSRASAGIGCHYMSLWMDRSTSTFTQMGGEGMLWVGQAPFSKTKHTFVNLGDGTYYHSGLLAIRAAVASGVNITYKILYNDAVAMTGGQPVDGPIDPASITRQVAAEGVKKIIVVTDEPDKYPIGYDWAEGVSVEHRDRLDAVQRDLRELEGVTVLLYDQTCAAEKRRRRKRGLFPDPDKRVFINDLVCEGCGDCSIKSNCVSVVPKETEFGTKRQIDQSSCNKDFSCVKGFCPSFVTVHGPVLRKATSKKADLSSQPFEVLPDPIIPETPAPYGILVTGVGGTGVVTIGALLGMAAHIEGKGVCVLDMTGLAQKGGAVLSHIRIANSPEEIHAVRISAGAAKLMLACDMVVAAAPDALGKVAEGETYAIVNSAQTITGDFTRESKHYRFPDKELHDVIRHAAGGNGSEFLDASRIASKLMGDSIAANLFMLGYAWQKGLVPLSETSIIQAIELNGVALDFNKQAFLWGRRAAHDLAAVEKMIAEPKAAEVIAPEDDSLDALIAKRANFLTDYQNAAYAERYKSLVAKARASEEKVMGAGQEALSRAVARFGFKLMAYKDEYEVARLYSHPRFLQSLNQQFAQHKKITFHLAPPLFAARDPQTGELQKREYGPWMLKAFGLMAKLKGLRGSAFDPFGHSDERKQERQLIEDYLALVDRFARELTPANHATAVALASLPDDIRGYGHVKEANMRDVAAKREELLQVFAGSDQKAAAE